MSLRVWSCTLSKNGNLIHPSVMSQGIAKDCSYQLLHIAIDRVNHPQDRASGNLTLKTASFKVMAFLPYPAVPTSLLGISVEKSVQVPCGALLSLHPAVK
ncbi:unnamed protein product [Ostreobium quekettii]|uniref:Uncharacterized protein n=1 Tax=Ostreobium quekettii TaxID=121088 RepID=A0A8S1J9X6_9CHLO|nr:unnamed protein product [Ostreobium quekettii]